jgi:hypothetical protein
VRFKLVTGNFSANDSAIETLDGSPFKVLRDYDVGNCEIVSLEHSPKEVGGSYIVRNNDITSLQHGCERVGKQYDCSACLLKTLHGAPQVVPGEFRFDYNSPLENLKGLPLKSGGLRFSWDKDLPLLNLALVEFDELIIMKAPRALVNIIVANKNAGRRGAVEMSNQLIDAGFSSNAGF